MAYSYSKIDTDNISWFTKDVSNATLLGIKLVEGRLRGLDTCNVNFEYPISAFCGKNGSGKSTLLALAACAYHNVPAGFKLPERKQSYYTFSDFFIQSGVEVPPQGIEIFYRILHNQWNKSIRMPTGIGIGTQRRLKKKGGKWNDYATRASRNVVFLGIERVVPHSEKQVFRTYKTLFKKADPLGWENKVKIVVGKILGKNYEDFWFIKHGKYRIPVVKVNEQIYSGFNMGAGEKTLFELFSIIYGCPKGALIIIDEIELGLHEEAQKKFIQELKLICKEQKTQIIATTHSKTILKHLPPIARFFIESFDDTTIITDSITPEFAGGMLAGENSNELDIFVEDNVAKKIIELSLSTDIRNRVNIMSIGSSSAISRQLAAHFKNQNHSECMAIMDGDKRGDFEGHKKKFFNALESGGLNKENTDWLKERLQYIPGDTWPEKWIINEIKKGDCKFLCELINISKTKLIPILNEALAAGKHNEFHTFAEKVSLDKDLIISICAKQVIQTNSSEFDKLKKEIIKKLK